MGKRVMRMRDKRERERARQGTGSGNEQQRAAKTAAEASVKELERAARRKDARADETTFRPSKC